MPHLRIKTSEKKTSCLVDSMALVKTKSKQYTQNLMVFNYYLWTINIYQII